MNADDENKQNNFVKKVYLSLTGIGIGIGLFQYQNWYHWNTNVDGG